MYNGNANAERGAFVARLGCRHLEAREQMESGAAKSCQLPGCGASLLVCWLDSIHPNLAARLLAKCSSLLGMGESDTQRPPCQTYAIQDFDGVLSRLQPRELPESEATPIPLGVLWKV